MEFSVLNHHQIYILTSSLLGQKENERGSEVILSFKIWRKVYCYPCTLQVEGIFSKGTKAWLSSQKTSQELRKLRYPSYLESPV